MDRRNNFIPAPQLSIVPPCPDTLPPPPPEHALGAAPVSPFRSSRLSTFHGNLSMLSNLDTRSKSHSLSSPPSLLDIGRVAISTPVKKSGFLYLKTCVPLLPSVPTEWREFWCVADPMGSFSVYKSLLESKPLFTLSRHVFLSATYAGRISTPQLNNPAVSYELEIDLSGYFASSTSELVSTALPEKLCMAAVREQDMDEWLQVLCMVKKKRARTTRQLPPISTTALHTVEIEGLVMKQAWLKKMSHGFKDWKRKFVVLKHGTLYIYKSECMDDKPSHSIDTLTCSAKVDPTNPLKLEIVTPQRSYYFLSPSEEETHSWMKAIQASVEWRIGQISPPHSGSSALSFPKMSAEMNAFVHAQVSSNPGNQICADCSMPDPEWASINLGIVMCIECSGIHRSLGVHVSKVRSLRLDGWEPENLEVLLALGNQTCNAIYESGIDGFRKPVPQDERETKEVFIRSKYVAKKFLAPAGSGQLANDPISLSFSLFQKAQTDDPSALASCLELYLRGAELNFQYDSRADSPLPGMVNGRTALHGAAAAGNMALTRWLLLNGADYRILDATGASAFDVSADPEIAAILKSPGDKTPLRKASESALSSHSGISKNTLLSKNCSTTSSGSKKRSPSGWLVKSNGKDGSKGWNKRFFRLEVPEGGSTSSGFVRYYRAESSHEPAGEVQLDEVLDIRPSKLRVTGFPGEWPFVFELHTWTRVYVLAACTVSEQNMWTNIFKNLITVKKDASGLPKADSPTASMSDDKENQAAATVFGVELDKLAERRQGSRDRGVPLFLSKCIGFFHQLYDSVAFAEHDQFSSRQLIQRVYSRNADGFNQADILALVKNLKIVFDENDEEVDLSTEFSYWKKKQLLNAEVQFPNFSQMTFLRSLILLMLHYFSSLPSPLMTPNAFERLTDIVTHLRSLAVSEAFVHPEDDGLDNPNLLSWDDVVGTVPSHLIQRLVVPQVRQLPDANYQTLKKLVGHLSRVYRLSSAKIKKTDAKAVKRCLSLRREIAKTWAGPLFGIGNGEIFDVQATSESHDNRLFLVELLVEHFDILFEKKQTPDEMLVKAIPQKDEGGGVFPVDVFVGNEGKFVVSRRIPVEWTAKQLIEDTITHLLAGNPSSNPADEKERFKFATFALHEVIPDGFERPLTLSEKVYDVTTSWSTPTGHRLWFKHSPIKEMLMSAAAGKQKAKVQSPYTVKGWLHKEGVAVKNWKKRYFVLKPEAIHYYKDERENAANLVGKLDYRDLGVYIQNIANVTPGSTPTPFIFCVRPIAHKVKADLDVGIIPNDVKPRFLCAESKKDMYRWAISIMRADNSKPLYGANPPPTSSLPSIPQLPSPLDNSFEQQSGFFDEQLPPSVPNSSIYSTPKSGPSSAPNLSPIYDERYYGGRGAEGDSNRSTPSAMIRTTTFPSGKSFQLR